jgi:hypothetical protein
MSAFPAFKGFNNNTNPQGQQMNYWAKQAQGKVGSGIGKAPGTQGPSGQFAKPMGLGALMPMGSNVQFGNPGFKQGGPGQVASKVQGMAGSQQKQVGTDWSMGYPRPMYGEAGKQRASMRDLYGGALVQDWNNITQAQEGNRQANLQFGAQMGQNAYADAARTEELGAEQGGKLDAMGQGMLQGSYEEGNKFRDEVKSRVEMTESEFKDRSVADQAAQAFGMDKNMEAQLKMVESGVGPDGMPMTPEQQEASRMQMMSAYQPQKQATMARVASDFNNALAGLRTQGTGLIERAGEFALGQWGQAQALAAGLSQASASLRMGANAAANERRLAGDQAGYQIISQNPFSPTSLAALFGSMMEVMDSGAGQYGTGFDANFMQGMQ